uniref:Jupiter microtubule associated homolog 1 n=1 Tax=Oryctolagus cuniculus TaxID=9986 RepID=A0A5F9CUB9_RABIT
MTTTTTFKGVDPNSRNSSQVLLPPGGGSNFSLGFDEPTEQPVRKNKMASSIFGTPEENPPSWAKSAGGREDPEPSRLQRRNSSEASSGDFFDMKVEGVLHENVDTDVQASLGHSEESLCLLHLCPALWPRPHAGETLLVASPASPWVNSTCPQLW